MSNYSTNYDRAFNKLMLIETGGDLDGGYNDIQGDAGGATKWGFAQNYNPDIDVRTLTRDQAKERYHVKHWKLMNLDLIVDFDIAYEIFENGINSNHWFAVQCVQGALNMFGHKLVMDGQLGPATASAINMFKDKYAVLKMQNLLQGMMLIVGFENFNTVKEMIVKRYGYSGKFLRGWMKRIEL